MAVGSALFENLICYKGWHETHKHTYKLALFIAATDVFVAKFLTFIHLCFVLDTWEIFRNVRFI